MLILQLINDRAIETQEELAAALREKGVQVTQATVSRDIKELHLIKVPYGDGRYRYAVAGEAASERSQQRLIRLLRECVTEIDASENIIVIKTISGTASTAGEAIDRMDWPEIIGSIAGDNTVFAVVKPASAVPEVLERLRAALWA